MRCLFVLAAVVCAVYGKSLYSDSECKGNQEYATLNLKHITDPIILREGADIVADFDVNIHKMFPSKFIVDVKVSRVVNKYWGIYIPIPCLFQVGSCEYKLNCDMLEKMQSKDGGKVEYQCPHPVGQVKRTIKKKLPKINSVLANLGQGEYWIKVTVKDESKNILACTHRYINIDV